MIPEIQRVVAGGRDVIVCASPGSGKTTRIPPALLDLGLRGLVYVLVPRRLAARLSALRVAEEMGETVGRTVGYQFRFEKVVGRETRLVFLTEGLLIRLLQDNPGLEGVSAVVLDEFHERHLDGDLALAYLKYIQQHGREDLRMIVMSATLPTESLTAYLPKAQLLVKDVPLHPVRILYCPMTRGQRLEAAVTEAVTGLETRGDILVFLPGMADILLVQECLVRRIRDVLIVPLHASLPADAQRKAFEKTAVRKVILATNVAETSLTFEAVTAVVDSGLHRQASHSPWSGIPTLQTRPISQASAIQRAGRAGRTGPGLAVRLYALSDFQGRQAFEKPEILRQDLSGALLTLMSLGVPSPRNFHWFEDPSEAQWQAAETLLRHLGALTMGPDAVLTKLGRDMARLPVPPRIARVLLAACEYGVLREAARVCARLEEGEVDDINLLDGLDRKGNERSLRLEKRLLGLLETSGGRPSGSTIPEAIARSFLAGFPDRVATCRHSSGSLSGDRALVFCLGGSGVVPPTESLLRASYFVVLEVQETGSLGRSGKTRARVVCPVEEEWLLGIETDLLREMRELKWNDEKGRVFASSQLSYGRLILSESLDSVEGDEGFDLLLRSVLGLTKDEVVRLGPVDMLRRLEPLGDTTVLEETLSRLQRLLPWHDRELAFLRDESLFGPWLVELFLSLRSRDEFRPASLHEAFWQRISPVLRAEADRELPAWISLPGRKKARIHYRWGREPWVESRLQDFFGLSQTPRLLKGSLTVLCHLLAPNGQAVQVTKDLEGFWKRVYPEVRPRLARRYPRHPWP